MTYQPQNINCETGVLFGCELSVTSGDNLTYDVTSGKVCIVDWTGVASSGKSRSQVLTLPAQSAITPLSADSTIFTATFVVESISAGIAEIQQLSQPSFTNVTRRNKVALPIVIHANPSGIIDAFSEDIQLAYEWAQQLNDMVHVVGVTSTGNRYSAGVSGNFINRASGSGARLHFNASNDTANPISRSSSAVSGLGFVYTKQVSGGGGGEFLNFTTIVDPDQFDSNGTLTSVSVNNFTIQTIFFFPQSSTQTISYGQTVFGSLGAAETAINDGSFDDSFVIPPNTIDGARVTYLIVREGTTDLNEVSDAKFIQNRNAIIKETGN